METSSPRPLMSGVSSPFHCAMVTWTPWMRKMSFESYVNRRLVELVGPAENELVEESLRQTGAELATEVGAGIAPVSHDTLLPTNCCPKEPCAPKKNLRPLTPIWPSVATSYEP